MLGASLIPLSRKRPTVVGEPYASPRQTPTFTKKRRQLQLLQIPKPPALLDMGPVCGVIARLASKIRVSAAQPLYFVELVVDVFEIMLVKHCIKISFLKTSTGLWYFF